MGRINFNIYRGMLSMEILKGYFKAKTGYGIFGRALKFIIQCQRDRSGVEVANYS
jgi:hypothetical protein